VPRRGWRGPSQPGEFPTLGWVVGEWIEANCVIPNGPQRGTPYLLTREMWHHLLHVYRLHPDAAVHPRYPRPVDGFVYYGAQLRRPQKWGKDPLGAVRAVAHALGPVQFGGWDADGEPVGMPVATPWVQIAGTSEDNTLNTWRPILATLRDGPLIDTPGLDVGDTRIKLPYGDGWMEPVTAAARSRLGNPITFATFTEPHLMTARDGGLAMIKNMKRNLGGMGGSWCELTNAWDPNENSAAQQTAKARAPGVYLDHRAPDLEPLSDEEHADDDIVRDRIVVKYGDSARAAGGWVDTDHILALIRDEATGEAEGRRFYLDQVVVGEHDLVSSLHWSALARPPVAPDDDGWLPPDADPDRELATGEVVVLGFDGSRAADCTALVACRVRDGRWFTLGVWDPADYSPGLDDRGKPLPGRIPESDVVATLSAAREAYTVWHLFADPYRWEHVLDRLSYTWGDNPDGKPVVVSFPTNAERLFDLVIRKWQRAVRASIEREPDAAPEWTHDDHPRTTAHARNAVVVKGARKPEREDDDGNPTDTHYLKIAKRRKGHHIDAVIAGLLATWARGQAIEQGALDYTPDPDPWVLTI
jgi:hypothetical protein